MNYKTFDRFILRTPIISFTHFQSKLTNEADLLKEFLDSQLQEALYVASSVLHSELKKLTDGKISDSEDFKRVISSVARYFSRMSTRCTPFGLFAGCSLGKIEDKTNIRLDGSFDRKTRLDMHYLYSLYDALTRKSNIREAIDYYPNTSLYPVENKYRYVECYSTGRRRRYRISEVERSKYLNKIVKKSFGGANYKSLINLLTEEGISKENAANFINELIDSQLLVGELNQSVTGDDFLSRLIHLLKNAGSEEILLTQLIEISALLEQLDTTIDDLSIYHQIIRLIKANNIPYEENYLFQVDIMPKTSTIKLGKNVIEELKSALVFLNKIMPKDTNQQLEQFKIDFYSRYETREMPLMTVLDPELGIGYPSKKNEGNISPLINDLIIPSKSKKTSLILGKFEHVLINKINECLFLNKKEILFTEKDIKHLDCNWDDLPPTMYAMFKILRSEEDDLLINFNFCGGSCGANLISRFSHLNKEIEQFVKEITIKEQELMPDVILAEVVHMPSDRIGNILLRPHMREYELLYMANSDLPEKQLIYLSDLMLSIRDNRLYLRSKKLNKEIIPRLTSAHNYSNNAMPVYHFLCDLQMQLNQRNLFFNLGALLDTFPYCPRIRYKNTILSPTSWTIQIETIKPFFRLKIKRQ